MDEFRPIHRYTSGFVDPRAIMAVAAPDQAPIKKKVNLKKYLYIALPFILMANLFALGDYSCMLEGKRFGFSHMIVVPISIEGRISMLPIPMYQCQAE